MDSDKGMKLRNERLSTLQSVEEQIKEKRMENSARPQGHTRSANLEHLYPDTVTTNKAMSYSGPSVFDNGILEHSDRGTSI